ncbi:hypothetical protein [uncultured Novosphingobium sp.]|uniref:hypothetical protein n=1 Tax=uncultured Novosphingobium sp. TaxID=292277 RepID=UPI0037484146
MKRIISDDDMMWEAEQLDDLACRIVLWSTDQSSRTHDQMREKFRVSSGEIAATAARLRFLDFATARDMRWSDGCFRGAGVFLTPNGMRLRQALIDLGRDKGLGL